MKTIRRKNYLKLGIFLLIFPVLLWQCQEKDDLDNIQLQSKNESYKILSLDDLPKLKPVIDNIKNFNSNTSVLNRSVETFMGVDSVLVDRVIQITKEGLSTYTFGIETDFYNSKYIENLHLIEVNEGYISFIIRYETPDGWEDDDFNKTPEGDLVFDPSNFNGKITKYTLEGEAIWTTGQTTEMYRTMVICTISVIQICTYENPNNPEAGPHPAGPGCTQIQEPQTVTTCYTVYFGGGSDIVENEGIIDHFGGGSSGDPNELIECTQTVGTLIQDSQPISGMNIGCSTNTDNGAIQTISNKRECEKIKSFVMATDTTYINKVRNLTSLDNQPYESAVTITDDGTITESQGTTDNGQVDIDEEPSYQYTSISHVHNEDSIPTYSVFSLGDLTKIAKIYKKGNIKTRKFVAFLSTADGTHYALTISNRTKFSEFFSYLSMYNFTISEEERNAAAQKFVDVEPLLRKYYNDDENPLIKEEQNPFTSLRLFMNFLKQADMGVTVFETVDSFQTFKELTTNEQGDVVRAEPCEF